MIFYTNPIPCILLLLIAVLHALSAFIKAKWGSVFGYVNIPLHIALIFSLLFLGADLSEVTLLIMTSLAIYVILYFVSERMKKGGENS